MAMLEILVGSAAALILFLYGIDNLSTEIQRIAGDRLRGVLARVMANRWIGALISALTTAVIQSSSATTVIAVGLVNSGIITFSQSLSVIAGANIGTTITAQMVALNLAGTGPFFMISGFLFSILGGKYRFLGKTIFYFGLVFFSLMLLSDAVSPLRGDPGIMRMIAGLENPLAGVLAGIAITTLLQSSSVTTGIVVILGMQGIIGLTQAIPVIMGANIGTTTTAMIAAQRLDVFAKRTALVHLLFNAMGAVIFMPFLGPFAAFVEGLGGDTGRMIANAHFFFNAATAVVFLVFADRIANFVSERVKSGQSEVVFRTKYLNGKLPERNEEAIRMVLMEMEHELESVKELFLISVEMAKSGRADEFQRAAKLEALTDFLDGRISDALAEISSRRLSKNEAVGISLLARISNEVEQLGDMGEGISIVARKMDEKGMRLLPESHAELSAVDALFFQNLELLRRNMLKSRDADAAAMKRNGARIAREISKSYLAHIKRLGEKRQRFAGTYFADVMAGLETANAKAVSIMEQRRRLGRLG